MQTEHRGGGGLAAAHRLEHAQDVAPLDLLHGQELGRGERGRRLIEAQLQRQPDNLSLLKHAAALAGACVLRRAAAS